MKRWFRKRRHPDRRWSEDTHVLIGTLVAFGLIFGTVVGLGLWFERHPTATSSATAATATP